MPRVVFLGLGALAALLAVVGWRLAQFYTAETLIEAQVRPPEAAPLCPWREPESDLRQFFPRATRDESATCILSGHRLELAQRLGRTPTGDENALFLYRVYCENTPLGTILSRRVKGVYGAIEFVLAADTNHLVCGLRLQRLREPEPVARALQNPDWLHSFGGKGADAAWQLGRDIPDVPPEARLSAQAVVEGTRSALILLAAADQESPLHSGEAPHHTHHH
jgi:hypothetical protein